MSTAMTPQPSPAPSEDERTATLLADQDRALVRDVLRLTPAERLETLRVVDRFFNNARPLD